MSTGDNIPRMGEASHEVSTQVGDKGALSIERNREQTPTTTREGGGMTLDHTGVHADDDGRALEPGHEGQEPQQDGSEGQQQEATEGERTIKLPDYDESKPEVTAEYEKAFVGEGGAFNLQNLSTHFFEHAKVDWDAGTVEGGLPEGTKKFLNSKGIDNATIDQVVAGQIAKTIVERNSVYSAAGGIENYKKAIEWATKGNGYTPAQREAFNKALDAGGQTRADAIEALMARAGKANPTAFASQATKKAVSPQRTVSNAGGGTGGEAEAKGDVYASKGDWSKEFRAAQAKGDQQEYDRVREKYQRSKKAGVPGFV